MIFLIAVFSDIPEWLQYVVAIWFTFVCVMWWFEVSIQRKVRNINRERKLNEILNSIKKNKT